VVIVLTGETWDVIWENTLTGWTWFFAEGFESREDALEFAAAARRAEPATHINYYTESRIR